jgi:hypothetical protein
MNSDEIIIAMRLKNTLIKNQSKRIALLEDKLTELRKSYFQLKYANTLIYLKSTL